MDVFQSTQNLVNKGLEMCIGKGLPTRITLSLVWCFEWDKGCVAIPPNNGSQITFHQFYRGNVSNNSRIITVGYHLHKDILR